LGKGFFIKKAGSSCLVRKDPHRGGQKKKKHTPKVISFKGGEIKGLCEGQNSTGGKKKRVLRGDARREGQYKKEKNLCYIRKNQLSIVT